MAKNEEPKEMTIFDYGFELSQVPLVPNTYNPEGRACEGCPIQSTCMLRLRGYKNMCFEGLQKMLVETDVFRLYEDKERMSDEENALFLYIDSMLYHLKDLPDAKEKTLNMFTLWDIQSDCAMDDIHGGKLRAKYAAICRGFGREAIEILRSRGYEI